MTWQEHITSDADVLGGKPRVKGTRLAVEFILDLMGQGWSEADLLKNYPTLDSADLQACLQYASDVLKDVKDYPAWTGK